MDLGNMMLNRYVAAYLLCVVGVQVIIAFIRRGLEKETEARRQAQGLSPEVLVGPATQLAALRKSAWWEAVALWGCIILLPFLIVTMVPQESTYDTTRSGLAATFVALLVWTMVSASDVLKSFVGGLTFKLLVAVRPPFQLHDRVTLSGHSGKVVHIGFFHVRLQTPNDDLVSIPTGTLWSQVLISANAGARSSLCVMNFYLAPDTDKDKRKAAEDIIWNAVQASTYFDPTQPLQVYYSQIPSAIVLTAKAYVANTYLEPDFTSDVTNHAFEAFNEENITLAAVPVRA